jgi:hypothetical protein
MTSGTYYVSTENDSKRRKIAQQPSAESIPYASLFTSPEPSHDNVDRNWVDRTFAHSNTQASVIKDTEPSAWTLATFLYPYRIPEQSVIHLLGAGVVVDDNDQVVPNNFTIDNDKFHEHDSASTMAGYQSFWIVNDYGKSRHPPVSSKDGLRSSLSAPLQTALAKLDRITSGSTDLHNYPAKIILVDEKGWRLFHEKTEGSRCDLMGGEVLDGSPGLESDELPGGLEEDAESSIV